MEANQNRLNLFIRLETIQSFLHNHVPEELDFQKVFVDCAYTVDIIDAPQRLFYRASQETADLELDRRGSMYMVEEQESMSEAQLTLNREGAVQGNAPQELQNVMQIYLLFCLNMSVWLREHGIFDRFADLNPETQGVLVEEDRDQIQMKPVEGDERPDLACKLFTGEVKTMRPYSADMMRNVLLEAIPMEQKEAAAEAGDTRMMRYLFDYYMGENTSPHKDLENHMKKMQKLMKAISGEAADESEEDEEEEDTRNPEKAFYWLKKLAESGDAESAKLLSKFYSKGFGCERDFAQAIRCLDSLTEEKKAGEPLDFYRESSELFEKAKAGDAEAQCGYALNLAMLGRLVPEIGQDADYTEAFQWAKKSAAQNNLEGIAMLVTYYQQGIGVPKDEKKAFRLCEKAAMRGHTDSQERLARMYIDGIGTEKNADAAIDWAKKAAEQGDLWAMKTLVRIFIDPEGGKCDLAEAQKWANKAADLGDEEAKQLCAQLEATFNGETISFEDAKKGAESGDPGAQKILADYYATGFKTERDLVKALYWMKKAAASGDPRYAEHAQGFIDAFSEIEAVIAAVDRGDAHAQAQLAEKYMGIFQNYPDYGQEKGQRDAFEMANKSASSGDPLGLCILGMCYENGYGTEVDFDKAFELYKQSAELGNPRGELSLSQVYLLGRGTGTDPDAAVAWLEKAELHGNPETEQVRSMYPQIMFGMGLDKMGDGANSGGPNPELGVRLVKKAAELGHGEAQGALGMLYLNGNNVEQDFETGIEWLRKAADSGNRQATSALGRFDRPEAYNAAANKEFAKKDQADKEKVFRLMKHAAEGGLAASQSTLGFLYMNGYGVLPDYQKGMEWFRKAADQGNENAVRSIQKYESADGLFLAAAGHNAYAQKTGTVCPDGYELLTRAIAAGSAEAINMQGVLYGGAVKLTEAFGRTVEKDYKKARACFEKALEIKPDLEMAKNNLKKLEDVEEAERVGREPDVALKWICWQKRPSQNTAGQA